MSLLILFHPGQGISVEVLINSTIPFYFLDKENKKKAKKQMHPDVENNTNSPSSDLDMW